MLTFYPYGKAPEVNNLKEEALFGFWSQRFHPMIIWQHSTSWWNAWRRQPDHLLETGNQKGRLGYQYTH